MRQEHIDWMVTSVSNVMDAIVTLEEEMTITDVGELLMYASMRYYLDFAKANPWNNAGTVYDAVKLFDESMKNLIEKAKDERKKAKDDGQSGQTL